MAANRTSLLIFVSLSFITILSAQPQWMQQASGTLSQLNSVAFFDTTTGLAVGANKTILRTSDGGIHWTASSYGAESWISSVALTGAGKAFFGSGRGCIDAACGQLYETSDSGLTWSFVSNIGADDPAISFANPLQGILVGGGVGFSGQPYNVILRTRDGGTTWTSYAPNVNNGIMADVSFIDTTFCIAIRPPGLVLRLVRDSLANPVNVSIWARLDSLDHNITTVFFVDTLEGFIAGDSGRIWRSDNGGQSWQQQVSTTTQNLKTLFFVSASEGYAAGSGGIILHTTDGGTTWVQESTPTFQPLRKIFFKDEQHGWAVGQNGTILKYGDFLTCTFSRTAIDFGGIPEAQPVAESLSVQNTGTETLFVASLVSDNQEFAASETSFAVAPGLSKSFAVTFNPGNPGTKQGHLIISHNAPSSPDTINLTGISLDFDTTVIELIPGWNLISNPRIVSNNSLHGMFPSATLAFQYDSGSGYVPASSIFNGNGYWIKTSPSTRKIAGVTITNDTIVVHAGWNLLGTISTPLAATAVQEAPQGILLLPFFGYNGSYIAADTLYPGRAYWIKILQSGKLILKSP